MNTIALADIMGITVLYLFGVLALTDSGTPSINHEIRRLSPDMRMLALRENGSPLTYMEGYWQSIAIEPNNRLFIKCPSVTNCLDLLRNENIRLPTSVTDLVVSLPMENKSKSRALVYEQCVELGNCELTIVHDGKEVALSNHPAS